MSKVVLSRLPRDVLRDLLILFLKDGSWPDWARAGRYL